MKGKTRKVTLPGEMYERSGRWWWRVRLPGETRAKARPLRAPGAKAAADDADTAEEIAVAMWEQAVAQTGARQITLDCTQKVERLKAQFLDKVRHLTQIVESANAKAQAEAQARAELETSLNAMNQTAKQQTEVPSPPGQSPAPPPVSEPTASPDIQSEPATQAVHQPSATPSPQPALSNCPPGKPEPGPQETVETTPPLVPEPSDLPEKSHHSGTVEVESPGRGVHIDAPEASEDARPAKSDPPETMHKASAAAATGNCIAEPRTGRCECCGAAGIPVSDLAPIDSGQRLCPDCLSALHVDISRIEADAFSDNHT